MKRIFDIFLAFILIIILIIPFLIIIILIRFSSKGPAIHWSKRFGKDNLIFDMPKFRTMRIETPNITTNSLKDPEFWVTKIGRVLRKYSLDELPQIYSILIGDMSFVGPRPALYNEKKLVDLRTSNNIHKVLPGITGLAQINGRDSLTLKQKVEFEKEYINSKSFYFDVKILFKTIVIVIMARDISH